MKCLGCSEVNIGRLRAFYGPEHQWLSSSVSGVWRQLMGLFSIRVIFDGHELRKEKVVIFIIYLIK